MSELVRIAIINDYDLVVQGVRQMLAPWSDQLMVVELDLGLHVKQPVDVALVDMFGQDRSTVRKAQVHLSDVGVRNVVVYTWGFTREAAQALLSIGVSGVVSKRVPASTLAEALLEVAAGETVVFAGEWSFHPDQQRADPPHRTSTRGDWPGREYGLTMREAEMIALISQGATNAEIAARLYLGDNTVKTYIRAAYYKIGVTRRSQAVAWGLQHLTPRVDRITLDV